MQELLISKEADNQKKTYHMIHKLDNEHGITSTMITATDEKSNRHAWHRHRHLSCRLSHHFLSCRLWSMRTGLEGPY